jgi:hypothetical protein
MKMASLAALTLTVVAAVAVVQNVLPILVVAVSFYV